MCDRTNVAGTHGQHHIAIMQDPAKGHRKFGNALDEDRLYSAARTHGTANGPAVGACNWRLARRIYLGYQQHVGVAKDTGEIVKQVARARIPVRLEREHNASPGPALAYSVERCGNFRRMVAVIIDHRRVTPRPAEVAKQLQAPLDSLKIKQRALDRLGPDAELEGDRDSSERVQYVVATRQVDRDRKSGLPSALHIVMRLHAVTAHVDGAHVGRLIETVSQIGSPNLSQDALHAGIVDAQHRESIERQVMQKVDEALLQAREVTVMRTEVVVVDVGDDRYHRLQVHE